MQRKTAAFDFIKDRHKWGVLLACLFALAVVCNLSFIYSLSSDPAKNFNSETFLLLYMGVSFMTVTGGVALWITRTTRKEVMIYRETDGNSHSLRGALLTISHPIVNSSGKISANGKKPVNLNGLSSEVVTIYAEDRTIRYISPAVENVLGYKQIEMIGENNLDNIHPEHRASFSHIFTRLRENPAEQIKLEYAYKTRNGGYIWLESVGSNGLSDAGINGYLLRTTDITEKKRIEIEVHQQNRKIAESIQYAKRIQGAILPNPRVIHRTLPNSFILYKPKDVVSGDFPWFAHVKNDIFMAAVDCTGHGVPGALLSLVGYFLLNDIVRSRRITEPGKILDFLDEGVSITLRSDDDSGTKDGMDISLCKINVEEREVIYAGAHRPLYVVKGGVLQEIKGNKFPIGGGIFKNQTNFTSNKIKLDKGDSIYFCSDGYCDQFGGPNGRKFGTRQLRDIISKVHAMPMNEASHVFETEWESWKGNQKQTDDVLLIGIKF